MKEIKLAKNPQAPSLTEEELLYTRGYRLIAGIDEVGRGALAGPVVAAAAVVGVGAHPLGEQHPAGLVRVLEQEAERPACSMLSAIFSRPTREL